MGSVIGDNCTQLNFPGYVGATVVKNQTTICTLNNLVNRGSITIVKDSVPDSNQDFNFITSGVGISNFTLDDGTDDDGISNSVTFSGLLPGSFTISESAVSGWDLTNLSCSTNLPTKSISPFIDTNIASFNLDAGENVTCTFTNTKRASVTAHKFKDNNTNGIQDAGEPNLSGWNMKLYSGSDCQGNHLSTANTDSSGNVLFSNIVPGDYSVKEYLTSDYKNSTPICQNVTVVAGESKQLNFGNFILGQINVCKYNDQNGDGLYSGDLIMSGWTINLTGPNGYSESKITDAAGCVGFSGLLYGSYTFSEVQQTGWVETIPVGGRNYTTTIDAVTFLRNLKITNFKYGSISGQKFNDLNGNGIKDVGENGLANWTINLDKDADGSVDVTAITDANGNYEFTNLTIGTYRVREQGKAGWMQTTTNPNDILIQSSSSYKNVNFGNQLQIGSLKIIKDSQPNDTQNFIFNLSKNDGQGNYTSVGSAELDDDSGFGNSSRPNNHTFTDIVAGTYKVEEAPVTGWTLENVTCVTRGQWGFDQGILIVDVLPGEQAECTFINTQDKGTLIAHKFEDKNNTEVQDPGENNLRDWDMNLYRGSDCRSGNYLRDLDTNSSGNANFSNIAIGDYSIKETLKSGWKNTTQLCQNVTVTKDTTSTVNFGNYRLGSITIGKDTDPDEGGNINDRTHFDYSGSLGDGIFYDEDTDTYGYLPIGQYTITETAKSGWILTNIICSDNTGVTKDIDNRMVTIELTAGKNITCTFKNLKLGRIEGYKFNDLNGNGVKNSGENKLSGWTITLDEGRDGSVDATTTTNANGNYEFENLTPGWYRVCEVPQTDWHSTLSGGAICRDTQIHNSGGDVDEVIFANRKLGSITVCKVITDTNGNVVNGSEVLGSSFTVDWDRGLADTVFNSGYTPNTDLFSDVPGDDAYCIPYNNLPINTYHYSQESITSDSAVWQIPLYNDQYETAVDDLGDFYNYGQNNDSNGEINLALDAGVHRTLVVLNQYKFASISGQKFNDLNANGQKDDGELGIQNWTINLDKDADGFVDDTAVTDSNGNYLFDKLTPNTYRLREVGQAGWIQMTTDPSDINLNAGDNVTNIDFGNVNYGTVNITKFNDSNGNGQYDEQEEVLGGWDINLSDNTKTTGENGQVIFEELLPDTYYLSEDLQSGWEQTNIYCIDQVQPEGVLITKPNWAYGHHGACSGWNTCGDAATCALKACQANGYSQLVSYGESRPCTQFENCSLFHDINQDLSYQENWGNWCNVMGVTDIYCRNGSSLPTATPTPSDFQVINQILDPKTAIAQEISNGNNNHQINLTAGQNITCFIGNQYVEPELTISKFNNRWPTTQSIGSEVEYTITLKVNQNNINDVSVVDLPPQGFKYKSGSYQVLVNGTPRIIPQPVYSSPGTWEIGDLNKDDVVTLTYLATIQNSVDPGTYKDAAWAYGLHGDSKILASSVDSGKIDPGVLTDTFVGTQIKIDPNIPGQPVDLEREEGQVLGASTELPATGANTIWMIVFLILSTLGLSSLYYGFKPKRKNMVKNLTLIIFLSLLTLIPAKSAFAFQSPNIYIGLENPISPTNQDNFSLSFSTLDILGRSLTVKCFKVNPDFSEVQIGSDVAIKPGGNSGNCSLQNNRLTESGKTYYFYAIAYADGESYRSDSVAVDYNTSGPGTPAYYQKDKEGSCRYKISFEASNDGKTTRIEIYRSDLTDFIADSGSKIGEVGISPGQKGSFTDVNVPDCNKTYYYVIRAFDSAGNASGLAGDFFTVYTTTTTSDTTGSVVPAIPIIGEDNLLLEDEADQTDDVDQDTGEPQEGSVLGSEADQFTYSKLKTWVESHPFLSIAGTLLLVIIIRYALSQLFKKKR